MARVLAVNNYPSLERFARLKKSLADNGAKVTVVDWRESSTELFDRFDGVVLSGSPEMVSEERVQKRYAPEIQAIRETTVPTLGICFGHQLMGHAFGSRVVRNGGPTVKFVETEVLTRDSLFVNLPLRITVFESHYEAVSRLPAGFQLLARSPTSAIATMKHSKLPLYGLQFHPERNSDRKPDGNVIVANFLKSLR